MKLNLSHLNNFFWLAATYLLAPYFYFLIFLRKTKPSVKLKILVIQTAQIGDMVCTTPIFREIKKNFPASHLSVLITSKTRDLFKNNPYVDEVILTTGSGISERVSLIKKIKRDKYDWSFNLLPGSFNSIIPFWSLIPKRVATTYKYDGKAMRLLSVFSNNHLEYKSHTSIVRHYLNLLRFVGVNDPVEVRELFVRPEEDEKASDFLENNNLKDGDLLIGIGVVPGDKTKQWALSKFAALADNLYEKLNAQIIFVGSKDDKGEVEKVQKIMQNKSVDSCGLFTLSELPAFLKRLKLFISVDSGALYMADAMGVPTVNIGGSYDIRAQAPYGNKYKILQKYPLSGLFLVPDSPVSRKEHMRCLNDTNFEEVLEASVALIKAN